MSLYEDALDAAYGLRCCSWHQDGTPDAEQRAKGMAACCDPDDCGPCCEDCPTCPAVARMKAGAR